VDFSLAAHIWLDRIDEIAELWAAGPAYFKVFTNTTFGLSPFLPGYLLRLFRRAADVDAICLVHCEDESMLTEREAALRAEGRDDFRVILEWRTREAEVIATQAVATLARLTRAQTVVAHATHPAAVAIADWERRAGARLSVESVPRYFYLREDEVLTEGPFRKFAPPARARNEEDEQAMWRAVTGGLIDHISSDHSPSTPEQKRAGNIWEAPFGVPGVENTLSLMLNAVHEGWVPLPRLVAVLCENAARTYGFYPRKGAIQVGSDADIVLVDLNAKHTFRNEDTVSKAGWTPYHGRTVHGRPVATFVRGRLVARDGHAVVDPGYGIFLPGRGAKGRAAAH
jgi:dihydroorotase-like cyclic amidohydrolase